MRLLIVSDPYSVFITTRLESEAKLLGHDVDVLNYTDMIIDISDRVVIKFKDREIPQYDAAILRKVNGKSMIFYKDILARELKNKGIVVLNGDSYIKYPYFGKLTQNYLFSSNGLPVIPTKSLAEPALLNENELKFPLILKKNLSSLGTGVLKFDSYINLKKSVTTGTSEFIVQNFLPTGEDYRIFVIGDEVLPKVMKKKAPEGKYITNYSQGGIVSSEDLTEELSSLAMRAAKAANADYCGVDIMYGEGKPYILEINRSANFEGFEGITKLNVARKTIEYLESIK
jgi:ribosomal protein S6--L-glutamate ligase/gamma-F420-2:alpha-L-glutamate ligase